MRRGARMFAAVMMMQLGWAGSANAAASEVTVEEAATRISAARGSPAVVVLFASDCPRSQAFLPAFDKLVRQGLPHRAKVLAFATDGQKGELDQYLSANRFAFSPVQIKQWPSGALSAAMKPTGVRIGATFDLPLVAVLDARGSNAGQWDGMSPADVSMIAEAIE